MSGVPSPLDLLSGVASARVEQLASQQRRAGPSSSTASPAQTRPSSSLRSTAQAPSSPPPPGQPATAHPGDSARLAREQGTSLSAPYRLNQADSPAPRPPASSARLVRLPPVSALIPSLPGPQVAPYHSSGRRLAPPHRPAPPSSHFAPPPRRPRLVFEPSRGFRQVESPPPPHLPRESSGQQRGHRMDFGRAWPADEVSMPFGGFEGGESAEYAPTSVLWTTGGTAQGPATHAQPSTTASSRVDPRASPRPSPRPADPPPAPSPARSTSSTPAPVVRQATPAGAERPTASTELATDAAEKDPVVSCTLWEDERCVVTQVLDNGHVVARRSDLDYVNCTKLLNMVPGLTRGKRDMYLKNEGDRIVFRRGALHLKGVWLPLATAARLAKNFDLYDCLYPLFEPDILKFLFRPINRERTTQLIQAARGREALVSKPDTSSGLSEEEREKLSQRGAALEKMLRELEDGLNRTAPVTGRSEPWALPSTSTSQQRDGDKRQARDVDESQRPAKMRRTASSGPSPRQPAASTQRQAAAFEERFQADRQHLTYTPYRPPPRPHLPLYTASGYPPSYMTYPLDPQQTPLPSPENFAAVPRRPSMDVGYTRDYRSSVSWYDNPTPPAHDMAEYFASTTDAAMRRMSTAEGGSLDVVRENEEVQDWQGDGAVAQSRPPQARLDTLRRLSLESDSSTMNAPLTYEPPYPMPLRDPYGRSLSLPASTETFAPFYGYQDVFSSDPAVLYRPEPPSTTPDEFDFGQIHQALYSPPFQPSRLGAARLSIDSAAEAVFPNVGLGSSSLVAPHTVGGTRTNGGVESCANWLAKAFDATDWAQAWSREDAAEVGGFGPSAPATTDGPLQPAQATFPNFPDDAYASTSYADRRFENSGSASRLAPSLAGEGSSHIGGSFPRPSMSPAARRDSLCGFVGVEGSASKGAHGADAGVKVESDD